MGEQVPPEGHSQAWEPERKELLETVQVGRTTAGMGNGRLGAEGRIETLTDLFFLSALEGGPG